MKNGREILKSENGITHIFFIIVAIVCYKILVTMNSLQKTKEKVITKVLRK